MNSTENSGQMKTQIESSVSSAKPINYCLGQGMVEYILVFVAIVVVLIAAVGPNGLFIKKIDESLNEATRGVKCMTAAICYDPAGCPNICP